MGRVSTKTENEFLAVGGEELINRKMYEVPLSDLSADPNQPRKHFDEEAMDKMVASINQHGVLQPVIFRRGEQGNLVLVSGERRFLASMQAGKESIPGVFIDGGDAVEIALVENLLRENLNPIEEAEALQRLREDKDYTQEQIAKVIGKAVPTISQILSLNKLPAAIKDECREKSTFSRRKLVEVAKHKTDKAMIAHFEKMKHQGVKNRDAVREQRREDVSQADALKDKVGKFRKMLDNVDMGQFGDDRDDVEKVLKALVKAVQAKLSNK